MSKKKPPQSEAVSQCRDCKLTARVWRYEFFKASRPRCIACGGSMEYLPFSKGTTRDVPKRKA